MCACACVRVCVCIQYITHPSVTALAKGILLPPETFAGSPPLFIGVLLLLFIGVLLLLTTGDGILGLWNCVFV